MTALLGESKAAPAGPRSTAMPAPVPYFEVVRQMKKNAFNYRLHLATHARQHGIKAAARAFGATIPTARKWLRRYQAQA